MNDNINNTRELKILSVIERPGSYFKPTDGKIWRTPMQEIETSDGIFIDNQPGVSLGWGSWGGHNWRDEVGNTVVVELSGTCGYTWAKFVSRTNNANHHSVENVVSSEINTQEQQLATILRAMYENAPEGYKTATLIHFGKTYRRWLIGNDSKVNNICRLAGDENLSKLPNRIRDGIKLADLE